MNDEHAVELWSAKKPTVLEPKPNPSVKIRKYNSDYLEIGFIHTGIELKPKPQCVICYEMLSNDCMKPGKLQRHLKTKHPEYQSKFLDFFKLRLGELKSLKKVIRKHSATSTNENATSASYEVSQLIAKCGKNHTIAEELVLPSALILCKRMLGDAPSKLIYSVPLPKNTVQ